MTPAIRAGIGTLMLFRFEFCVCGILAWGPGALAWGDDTVQDSQPRVAITPRSTEAARREAAKRESSPNLRLEVNVVLIPVTVTDGLNRPVTTLPKESFRLLEDGVEQKITWFLREEAPISVGLLFDSSGSMKNSIDASIEALKQLFQTTIEGDEFFLVQFSDQARLLSGFTRDPDQIYRRLGYVQPKGWTALLDGVALGTREMKSAHNRRRALLILSDGNDNNSRFSASEVRNMVLEGDLCVFAICLYRRPRILQTLADETGGKVLVAQNMNELFDLVYRLSVEMRSQYLLGYSPTNLLNDGKYRRVKVELLQQPGAAPLRSSWRRGYYAPGEAVR